MVRIIGITGKAHAGKDTTADILAKKIYPMKRIAIAQPLKDICSIVGFTRDQINVSEHKEDVNDITGICYREFAQKLSDYIKSLFGEDYFVRLMMKNVRDIENNLTTSSLNIPGITILLTDVRFPYEAKAIKDAGGLILQVIRPKNDSVMSEKYKNHSSEQGIPSEYVSHRIVNDGTIQDLEISVDIFLKLFSVNGDNHDKINPSL